MSCHVWPALLNTSVCVNVGLCRPSVRCSSSMIDVYNVAIKGNDMSRNLRIDSTVDNKSTCQSLLFGQTPSHVSNMSVIVEQGLS